jgi:hypothetical protein
MQTDAGGDIVFRSSKGRFYHYTLAVLFSVCALLFLIGIYRHITGASLPWLFFLLGSLLLLTPAVAILMTEYTKYVFEKDGIRFPHGDIIMSGGLKVIPDLIPYTNIIKFYETNRVTGFTLGASLDQVWIEYLSDKGKKSGIGLSPANKQYFIEELTKRTGLLISADPHAKN